MIAPGTRVHLKAQPTRKGTVVLRPGGLDDQLMASIGVTPTTSWVVWDGRTDVIPFDDDRLARIKNTLVIIGCTGNRQAYLNVPKEEAIRRFLARENEHVYHEEDKKTELDSCDRVEVIEFDDEFPTY